MVVGPDWIWLHVPKCGGTSVTALLRENYKDDPTVIFDKAPHIHPLSGKRVHIHQNTVDRMEVDPTFDPTGKRIVAHFRRLPEWIVSRIHFEAARPPHLVAPRDMMVEGRFFQNSGGVSWADRMIAKFALSGIDTWVPIERMHEGLEAFLGRPLTPLTAVLNKNRIDYIRDTRFWFTKAELETLYHANPRWSEIERGVYGDLIA
jgi:hypothetical protein